MNSSSHDDAQYGLELLAFGAHPDDVELTCGGLIASSAARGYRVGIVDLTQGEMATRGTPETRRAEASAAAVVLGVQVRENIGLPDAGVWAHAGYGAEQPPGPDAPVALVVDALRRHRPELVVVPHPTERHPDHEQSGLLLRHALFLSGLRRFFTRSGAAPFRPRQVLLVPMRIDVEASLLVDISAVAERKYEAIASYASQVGPAASGADALPTLIGSPMTLELARARDRVFGGQLGVAAAEPYVLAASIGLADPIDHFRRNSFDHPHYFPRRR